VSKPAKKPPADQKKAIFLGVLVLIAAIALYVNVFAGDSSAPSVARVAQPVATAFKTPAEAVRREPGRVSVGEFKPRQGYARPEDRVDPATIDPTLRLDLLAKVQSVEPEQSLRNIFQYGPAPPPPAAKQIDLPKTQRIAINSTPPPPRPAGPVTPSAPTAPQMTFKYYGFKTSKVTGRKEAFLLDGEEIIIAGENDAVKGGRYRIVRIGPSTITIEDTQFKANQTLTLQEEAAVA
jgi:hypothetical protein